MDSSSERTGRGAAIRTFLIADIRGYTRFTAQHGDEAASRLAARFAQVAAEGIEAWGGELVELRGDEALAVFGSARSALRAAVELQSAFADETRADPDLPLGVGIGLDAGEAVAVGDGYRGAALNLASRLCSVAAAGEVLASESLIHLAGQLDGLDYTPTEPATFKGYDQRIAASRVSARVAPVPPTTLVPGDRGGALAPLPPALDAIVPMAGRERELCWLRWHWRRAAHGHGRAVVLSGAPGIGKTRLAAAIATVAHEAGASVVYVPGAGLAADDLERATGTPMARPALVVVDDLDAAAAEAARSLGEGAGDLAGRCAMLLVTHRREAPPQLVALAERLAPAESRRTVGPLDADAVRAIVALYAGHAAAGAPIDELAAESGGVPAVVHRVASGWARSDATRRLGASAERTSSGRRGLRDAETALVDDVADLELARERERLYAAGDDADAGDGTDAAIPAARTVCPYKGLAEFEAADADHYFGRERLVAELIARSVGGTFLGLVGDSGSGKSSALRAGLLPALAAGVLPGSDTWPQAILRPGEQPVAELLRALARALPQLTLPADDAPAALDAALASLASGQRLVLVVDQFEEVFNATRDDAVRSAFIGLLTAERRGLKVVLAMRADHYGRCAVYPALARLLGSNQVLVGPLSASELSAVIELPAQRVGLRVEPALTEALVADAGDEPGVLPLLSTALLELWGARQGGRLTLAAYRTSGGLQGSIARLAEATYADLDPHRQDVARALLLRLAGPGEGSELVRRRVPLGELDAEADPVVGEVLATLTAARLLTAGDGHVEVAHEALLREWPRLQGWLAEDAAGRQVRLHLIGAVRDWQGRGREPSDLYRGARLAAALDWAAEHQLELNASERSFLDESRLATERDADRQRRTNRRLRALLAGAAVLLLLAVGAGGFAAVQGQRAEDEARTARARELMASAVATRDQDPSLSKLLAAEALTFDATPTYQSTNVLHQVLAADPIVARYEWPNDKDVGEVWTDIDPTGHLFVASGSLHKPSHQLDVVDATTGSVMWSDPAHDLGAVIGPSFFSADGMQVIAGRYWTDPNVKPPDDSLGVMIWDAHTGTLVRRIDVGPCGGAVTAVAEGRLLVRSPTPGSDGRTECHWPVDPNGPAVVSVDLATGASQVLADRALLDSFDGPGTDGGTLSGDGRFAGLDVYEAGTVTSVVVEIATGKRVFEIDPRTVQARFGARPFGRRLNHDGSLLLYGDRPMLVYDIAAGPARPLTQLANTGESRFAEFDPTGDTVYWTSLDGTLRRADAHSGQASFSWSAVGAGRPSVAADGRTVLVSDFAMPKAVVLDVGASGDLGGVSTCPGFVPATSLDVGDGLAAFLEVCHGNDTGFAQVIDLGGRSLLASLPGWGAQTLAVSPDGTSFAAQDVEGANGAGPVKVADLRTGSVVTELSGLCSWDGALLDAGTPPEAQPGCRAYPDEPFPIQVDVLRWSPDGTMIAVIDALKGFVAVWGAHDGRLLFRGPTDRSATDVVFSPDSRGLIVAHTTGLVETLSTETWGAEIGTQQDLSVFGVDSLRFVGFLPGGATILAVGGFRGHGGASLFWLDDGTLKITKTVPDAHIGSVQSAALSPDGSTLATGASDGTLRVWDAASGKIRQQMQFASLVQGVAFIDDRHLAVTPMSGDLLVMVIDPTELANTVRASITRPFTTTECDTYGINPCPTIEESRAP